MKKYLKTTEIAVSNSYPYGRLTCTKTWAIEHRSGKGFRVVEQTTNPKTGRLNAPKKSTYYPVMVLTDDNGFIKTATCSEFGSPIEMLKSCAWLSDKFDLFTEVQIKDIFAHIAMMLKVELQAICTYCGADPKNVMPLLAPALKMAIQGMKTGENLFSQIQLDAAAIEACKVPDFKPFRVSQTYMIGADGMKEVSL